MPDLVVDLAILAGVCARVDAVLLDFESTRLSDVLSDAVGHPVLEGAVRAFRDAWSIRREQLAARLEELREATSMMRETYILTDGRLARGAERLATGRARS